LQAGAPLALAHFLESLKTAARTRLPSGRAPKTERVDVLINNAGGALGLDPVARGRDEDWENHAADQCAGLLRMTRALLPLMVNHPGSYILTSAPWLAIRL